MAVRRILEQLRACPGAAGGATRLRVSGRSVRHLKRWYKEVTEPLTGERTTEQHGTTRNNTSVAAPETPERGSDDENDLRNVSKLRSSDRPATRDESRDVRRDGANQKLPPAPVAIVVEDTEGFDARVLGDLLLALSDAADTLPVCVLLGVATSANMVHALLPAATAARLDARAFKLYAPKDVMAAVTARVLMDPARAPALSNAALELLATRFKEHDFSLSAARRAVHLLTLEHFMYQPLAAAAPAADGGGRGGGGGARRARRARADTHTDVRSGHYSASFSAWRMSRDVARDDATVNAADPARDAAAVRRSPRFGARGADGGGGGGGGGGVRGRLAHAQVRAVGEKHLGLGTKEEVARALRGAFPARKRWGLAVRCVAAGAAASGARKGELSALFVDASAAKWMTEKNASASQGESLLRLICARLERDDTDISVIRAAFRRWARLVALEPAMHAEYGEDLRAAAAATAPRRSAARGFRQFFYPSEKRSARGGSGREERRGRVPK